MAKKVKAPKVDGLSPKDKAKIRNAIRQIWQRSYPRKLCVNRCIGKDGFSYCERCKARSPKVFIDHIEAVGDILNGGVERMFTASMNLQGLCKTCHDAKTKAERGSKRLTKVKKALKKKPKSSKDDIGDFY